MQQHTSIWMEIVGGYFLILFGSFTSNIKSEPLAKFYLIVGEMLYILPSRNY